MTKQATAVQRTSTLALVFGLAALAVTGCDPNDYDDSAELEERAFDDVDGVSEIDNASEFDGASGFGGIGEVQVPAGAPQLGEIGVAEFYSGVDPWMSDYDLALEGEPLEVPGLNVKSPDLANAGSRPIHVQKYGPFGNGGTLGTGFPTSDWIAVVVGLDTTDGDINENGTGDPLRAYPWQSNGIWNVTFDLRSHNNNESWSIWVMYIQRSLASSTNF